MTKKSDLFALIDNWFQKEPNVDFGKISKWLEEFSEEYREQGRSERRP